MKEKIVDIGPNDAYFPIKEFLIGLTCQSSSLNGGCFFLMFSKKDIKSLIPKIPSCKAVWGSNNKNLLDVFVDEFNMNKSVLFVDVKTQNIEEDINQDGDFCNSCNVKLRWIHLVLKCPDCGKIYV